MASLKGRMTLGKGQAKQPVLEDYQPSVEWSQDPETHLLRVDLPGFKKEELKVQVDNSRKLTVKGRRQEADGRFVCFEKAFDVPKDSIIEKISGRFEDGCLFLIMPKKPDQEPKQEACSTSTGEPSQEKKEDSTTPKDSSKEKQKVAEEEKKEDDSIMKEKPKNAEKKEDQDTIHGDKPQEKEGISEGPIHEEKHKNGENVKKKEEGPVQREARKIYEEMKKAHETSWEEYIGGDDGHFEKNKKIGVAKRKREEKEEQGWLDCGLVDDLLEKINRNRKVIAVAFVAFSVGFYVSHKLRQRG